MINLFFLKTYTTNTTITKSTIRPATIAPVTAPLLDDFDVWAGPIMIIEDEPNAIDDNV
jgi:hypothetical protein